MSLLDLAMTECVMVDKTTRPDGYGGVETVWVDGAVFNAAVAYSTSIETRVAVAQGVTSVYTVTTGRGVNLQYHDVFRRLEDGKVFRVTSDGDDLKTPVTASINMRNVSAEEWRLPNG